ncbi:L-threonylcarbamoyladenylate synthase [Desulfobaculum bizertense]|uniref:L-threonylcarbamoyladenylate synthase n=1 Tax=Desulfobaculum bizertense DSM 18034 TaxID=1121442 RepID=A0A1T4W803_9BACT|nr:L-threonylcarbamoyladenylate synthase [Desulfobaculum bizertense]SKA73125.1 L-threonylcarbamoyladenylate synthase [Desulfobaculum bizertense DSM 18034]
MHQVDHEFEKACEALRRGDVIIYPTETLYAIGCDAFCAEAAARVYAFKKRSHAKPLPVLIGDASQLSQVTDWHSEDLEKLARRFWPGPLSVIVPAREGLPREVQDAEGTTSVRVTPHPVAARLSRELGRPLVATSANLSGEPSVARPDALSKALCQSVSYVFRSEPWPGGGEPSTVIAFAEPGVLVLHREGAISKAALEAEGFVIQTV